MTNINNGVNNLFIAGEVYDFEEAKEIEGIVKVVVLMQSIRKIASNK